MKRKFFFVFLFPLVLFVLSSCRKQNDFPTLQGPYLGQKPPGMTPEVFAPGILNTDIKGAFCSVFSPAGDEFYFVQYQKAEENSGGLYWMNRVNDVWSEPEKLIFSGEYTDNDICVSYDGHRLFFRSWRPLPGQEQPQENSSIWFVERSVNGWSEPNPVECGGVVLKAGYPSITYDGTLFFPARREGNIGESDIHLARFKDGVYQEPENLGTPVNTPYIEGDMFIAPDESFLIVSCWDRPENIGSGQGDLYISFRNNEGSWTESINMGEIINTEFGENCPMLSPDGKYFFFNRYNPDEDKGNIYWVDALVLDKYKKDAGLDVFPVLKGPYLGQKPPGKKPQVFAPGIISTSDHAGCSGFLSEGTVFVFSKMIPGSDWKYKPTYFMELKEGFWTKPILVPFNDLAPYNFTVAPDDLTLYFTSIRSPQDHRKILTQANIWIVQRQKNGWSEPVMLGPSINTDTRYENYPTVTRDGTIYYMSRREGNVGQTDIFRSRRDNGQYAEAENLGKPINTEESDQDPFIAADESYLIVCLRKPDGYGEYDLYISFRKQNGSWTEPVNMGSEINSHASEFTPYVTPDEKYFFFTSNRDKLGNGNVYWVDARIIEEYKPVELY